MTKKKEERSDLLSVCFKSLRFGALWPHQFSATHCCHVFMPKMFRLLSPARPSRRQQSAHFCHQVVCMMVCKCGALSRWPLLGLIWWVLCGQVRETLRASSPLSVSSAVKQSVRLSGCWLVHSACLVSHVKAMQVYKPHTPSGRCLVGRYFGPLPPPPRSVPR